MQQLQVRRLTFSREADTWLRMLKSRTDVTPNLLCRVGFCISLEERGHADPSKFPEDSDRKIERHVLLGEYDSIFVSLLRQRMMNDKIDQSALDDQFRAHMNRGVILLAGRLKALQDVADLFKASTSAHRK